MSGSDAESVTQWMVSLQRGSDEAAYRLWDRYFSQLVQLARHKLGTTPRRIADEEDLAVSVFRRLCDAAANGRLDRLNGRDDLWPLLVAITTNRVIDHQRHLTPLKRGGGAVRGNSVFNKPNGSLGGGFEEVMANEPDPQVLIQLGEQHERLMALLDDGLRQIAGWKLESLDNEEIASRLGITSRSVRRKIERIREIWLVDLEA